MKSVWLSMIFMQMFIFMCDYEYTYVNEHHKKAFNARHIVGSFVPIFKPKVKPMFD